MPYLSLYLHQELKIPMTIVGVILMLSTVIGAVLGLYGGELSDRRGRKWVMVRSLLWRFFIFIILGFAISMHADIYLITILLIANSSFGSFFIPASQSYIADLIVAEKRTPAYGLLRIGGNLGWALGPAIGGLLATIDYAYLFYFTAVCMFMSTIILSKFTKESLPDANSNTNHGIRFKEVISVVKDQRFLIFSMISLVIFIVWGQLVSPLSVYSVDRVGITKTQLGILFSINGFMVVVFQYFITNFIPSKKELTALWIGSLVYGLGYLTVGLSSGFLMLVLAMVIITIAEMVVTPTALTYASVIADDRHKGRYLGFFNLFQSLGWAFGPLIGGIFLDTFSGQSLFIWVIISLFALIAAAGFFVFRTTNYSSQLTSKRKVTRR